MRRRHSTLYLLLLNDLVEVHRPVDVHSGARVQEHRCNGAQPASSESETEEHDDTSVRARCRAGSNAGALAVTVLLATSAGVRAPRTGVACFAGRASSAAAAT